MLPLPTTLIVNRLFIYLFSFSFRQQILELIMKKSSFSCFFFREMNAKLRFILSCCSLVDFPDFLFTNVRLVFNVTRYVSIIQYYMVLQLPS